MKDGYKTQTVGSEDGRCSGPKCYLHWDLRINTSAKDKGRHPARQEACVKISVLLHGTVVARTSLHRHCFISEDVRFQKRDFWPSWCQFPSNYPQTRCSVRSNLHLLCRSDFLKYKLNNAVPMFKTSHLFPLVPEYMPPAGPWGISPPNSSYVTRLPYLLPSSHIGLISALFHPRAFV